MEGNNAPFAVNQKVVALGESAPFSIKKGDIVTVGSCFLRGCSCKRWTVGVVETPGDLHYSTCSICGEEYFHETTYRHADYKWFAPIQHQYTDISKELCDSFQPTEEVPDKIIVPEKVNN